MTEERARGEALEAEKALVPDSGCCHLEEEINMAIAVSTFMTLIQELRKQICNCTSSSKGLTSVS